MEKLEAMTAQELRETMAEKSLAPKLRVVFPPLDADGEHDDFCVEFEILPPAERDCPAGSSYAKEERLINKELGDIDSRIADVRERVAKLNKEIDRLTNHADGWDYATAVMCGIIAGIIDSIYVGAWDFAAAKKQADIDTNKMVQSYAEKLGFKYDPQKPGGQLSQAIEFLEKRFPLPSDNAWNFKGSGISTFSHHLDDYCHHPTLVGLLCCIIVQFTGKASYRDKNGVKITKDVEVNSYGEFSSDNPVGKVFCGVVNWFVTCAKTIANRKGHLLSDMAGSSAAKTGGAGIPGSFISTLKELSSFFGGKDKDGNPVNAFADSIRRAYQNGIGTGKSQVDLGPFNCLFAGANSKFDARTEMAVKGLLKKQAVPVLVNEALVRGTYFIRHLIKELREKKSFAGVEWQNVIPFNNRTIVRMMTIATGTFTACDLADATIRSGISNGFAVQNPKFWTDIILRVNFVGVGRFAVAVATDAAMGVKSANRHWDRISAQTEHIHLLNARVQYKMADVWIHVDGTERAMHEFQDACSKAWNFWQESYAEQNRSLKKSVLAIKQIDAKSNGFKDFILEELEEP